MNDTEDNLLNPATAILVLGVAFMFCMVSVYMLWH